jgi:hypothetical protein
MVGWSKMKPVIFVGPTLSGDPILASPKFEWLPPATEGDIYRTARRKDVRAIGLIDGQFESVPSVWHKEILWALSRGIRVFGASSIGALRAAELSDFGMIGVGTIFRQYRNNALRDDDEVAVLHAPFELGYRPLTDSMVDIRATIAKAQRRHIVSRRSALALVCVAKNQFYKDRTWNTIIEAAGRTRVPEDQLERLIRWLPLNTVDLKRRDALALLRLMLRSPATRRAHSKFQFHHTVFWQELVRSHSARSPKRPLPSASVARNGRSSRSPE